MEEEDEMMRISMDKADSFLSKYITKYGLRAAVLLRKMINIVVAMSTIKSFMEIALNISIMKIKHIVDL